MGEWLLGTDVSDFQDPGAWDAMVDGGVEYAWAKQNQGSFVCQTAITHRKAADQRGKKIGGYSWAVFNAPARSSAETFVQLLQAGPNTLPPCWDVEDVYSDGSPTGSSPAQRADWLEEAIEVTETEMGHRCIIYTGGWYFGPYVEARQTFGDRELWIASYRGGTALPEFLPDGPAPWNRPAAVWQFAGDVSAFGLGSTDLNVTTRTNLAALTGGTTTTQGGLFMAGEVTSFSGDALTQLATALGIGPAINEARSEAAALAKATQAHIDQVALALGQTLGAKDDRNALLLGKTVMDNADQHARDDLAQHEAELRALAFLGAKPGDAQALTDLAAAPKAA